MNDALASSLCKKGSKQEPRTAPTHSLTLASSLLAPPLLLASAPEPRRNASNTDVDVDDDPGAALIACRFQQLIILSIGSLSCRQVWQSLLDWLE